MNRTYDLDAGWLFGHQRVVASREVLLVLVRDERPIRPPAHGADPGQPHRTPTKRTVCQYRVTVPIQPIYGTLPIRLTQYEICIGESAALIRISSAEIKPKCIYVRTNPLSIHSY